MGMGDLDTLARSGAPVEERAVALVIDPDGPARQETAALLQSSGYDVLVAGTGEDGLALAREYRPLVVAVEVDLPGIDGWEATRQLRLQAGAHIAYILMVTASGDEADVIGALHAGADTVVRKPLRPHEFRARVTALTRRTGAGVRRSPAAAAPQAPAPAEAPYVEQLWTRPAAARPVPAPAPAVAHQHGFSRAPQTPITTVAPAGAPAVAAAVAPRAPEPQPAQPVVEHAVPPVERSIEWQDFRGLSYEPIRRMVAVDGRPLEIDPAEFDLMLEVLLHGGAICRRDELAVVLRADSDSGPVTQGERVQVDRLLASLTGKLGEVPGMPRWLEIIPSVGARRVNA